MDRIKSICIEEELCQSHDGSLEQILKQMLSYKKLYNLVLSLAEQDERIRIVTLEGSRANINIPKDEFQDAQPPRHLYQGDGRV